MDITGDYPSFLLFLYVDLNAIRAGMAQTPETSEYTSTKDRAEQLKRFSDNPNQKPEQPSNLHLFVGNYRDEMPKGLPFDLDDYLQLIDRTGRAILENKRGYIPCNLPPILERLEIDPENWLYMTQHFESKFKVLVDTVHSLKKACKKLGYRRTSNLAVCQRLLM